MVGLVALARLGHAVALTMAATDAVVTEDVLLTTALVAGVADVPAELVGGAGLEAAVEVVEDVPEVPVEVVTGAPLVGVVVPRLVLRLSCFSVDCDLGQSGKRSHQLMNL